jgi:NAD-dependent dihydropyrimidine dehydrogenase PreA subunit
MAYVITQPCVNVLDRACVEVCPVQCFYEAGDQLVIHPQECVDCDACKPVCPTAAIFPLAEVPAEWQEYIQKNADWFATHPKPIKALTTEEAKATGLSSPEVSMKLLAGELGGQAPAAAAAVAEVPKPATEPAGKPATHEAAKPAAAAPPKPAAPKPQAPVFPQAENYARAKALLAKLVEAQAQAGELTDDQTAAGLAMVAELRKEIAAAFGKAEVTLSDLEKKSITWRQHEEVARALLRCVEMPGPLQVKRRLVRRFTEYAVGAASTGGLTIGAMALAWQSVQDWTFRPSLLEAPLQPEGFAVGIGFGMMAAILAPFALFAVVRMISIGRQVLALGGFDRAAALRTLEMQAPRRGAGAGKTA